MTRIFLASLSIICKSPMAEIVMRNLAEKSAMGKSFYISAAATSREAIGDPSYPPARRKLEDYGSFCAGHAARQMTICNYADCDLLIGMSQVNVLNIVIFSAATQRRISFYYLLMEYAGQSGQGVTNP